MKYIYIDKIDLLENVKQDIRGSNYIALDTETGPDPKYGKIASGLDPHTSILSLVQIKGQNTDNIFLIDILKLKKENLIILKEFFIYISNSQEFCLIAHNAIFEYCVIRHLFNIRLNNLKCTMQMSKLIANATGSKIAKVMGHSYKDLCRDILDIHIDKTQQTSNWLARPLTKTQLEYAAEDVERLHDLFFSLYDTIHSPIPQGLGMAFDYNLEMDLIEPLAEMKYVGLAASKDMFKKLQYQAYLRINKLSLEIGKELDLPLDSQLIKGKITIGFNPASVTLLRHSGNLVKRIQEKLNIKLADAKAETLKKFLTDLEETHTSEEILTEETNNNDEEDLANILDKNKIELEISSWGIKCISNLIEFKKLSKFQSINYESYFNINNCICSSVDSGRAATGRMGSSNPNAQNIDSRTKFLVEVDLKNPFISSCSEETMILLLK
jgi:DNA polymerase I-like protein with 3'-5' exonuclease and polymerase domains